MLLAYEIELLFAAISILKIMISPPLKVQDPTVVVNDCQALLLLLAALLPHCVPVALYQLNVTAPFVESVVLAVRVGVVLIVLKSFGN